MRVEESGAVCVNNLVQSWSERLGSKIIPSTGAFSNWEVVYTYPTNYQGAVRPSPAPRVIAETTDLIGKPAVPRAASLSDVTLLFSSNPDCFMIAEQVLLAGP